MDAENPLHVIAALHPQRHVRLAALKLSRKLDINITDICNFKCSYCYQRSRDGDWRGAAERASVSHLGATEWVQILDQAASIGVSRVKFTGGEPFTKPEFLEIFRAAYERIDFDEVEIVSNISLLKGRRLEQLLEIVGDGARLHLHISIDGYREAGQLDDEKIFTPQLFADLAEILRRMSRATFSVNSMWNGRLVEPGAIRRIHGYLTELHPDRWSISLPYLVKDVVDGVRSSELQVPDFAQIIDSSRELLSDHAQAGRPFPLSIPLVWKHEVGDDNFGLSTSEAIDDLVDHPCYPCHGSYFIIGPKGDLFDCLLLDSSVTSLRDIDLIDAMNRVGIENEWYSLTVADVSTDCHGCRYEKMCRGQCPSDRANASVRDGTFGRDLSACSLLVRAEKELWTQLGEDERRQYQALLNRSGFFPASWKSLRAIIEGDAPISGDVMATGELRPPPQPRRVSVRFHTKSVQAADAAIPLTLRQRDG